MLLCNFCHKVLLLHYKSNHFKGFIITINSFSSAFKDRSSLPLSLRLNWFIIAAGTVVLYEFAIVDAFAPKILHFTILSAKPNSQT